MKIKRILEVLVDGTKVLVGKLFFFGSYFQPSSMLDLTMYMGLENNITIDTQEYLIIILACYLLPHLPLVIILLYCD